MPSVEPTSRPDQFDLPLRTRPEREASDSESAPDGRFLWTAGASGLALLCAVQLLTWIPHYVTWPWWNDHDVFASAARAWGAGTVPYRDYWLNNFPGTIYLFLAFGVLFGWGVTWPLYAFDAALLVLLGVLLCVWSRRVFGASLPGLAAFALFVSYYLDLNYAAVAQRDWHGPFLLLVSLLILQIWPGRAGWIVAGLSAAFGFSIRPQVVLFAPALALALDQQVREPGEPWRQTVRPLLTVAAAGAVGMVAMLLPLFIAGALDDFMSSLSTLAPGGPYSQTTAREILRLGVLQVSPVELIGVPLVVGLLWRGSGEHVRRPARVWAAAYAGALLYAPLSPSPHLYLRHPLALFWSMMAAILVAMAIEDRRRPVPIAAALVLLVLSSGLSLKPQFSDPGRSIRALTAPPDTRYARRAPLGYTSMAVMPGLAARYDWSDYRALLDYLRDLPQTTRVGNALYAVPALAGPSGRLPLFPAESIALLTVVGADVEGAFVEAMREAGDAVVVWSPSEVRAGTLLPLPRLFAAIEEYYVPDRQFGEIEVWRRRQIDFPR